MKVDGVSSDNVMNQSKMPDVGTNDVLRAHGEVE